MKTQLITIIVAGLVLGPVGPAPAHIGGRIFPIFELTDAHLAVIDLQDGLIDEWLDIVGDPTVTALHFAELPSSSPFDPADVDFRIWLGWHEGTNRIYGAMQQADDVYVLFDEERQVLVWLQFHDAGISFYIDGDHSGGEVGVTTDCCDTDAEYLLRHSQTAQGYMILGGLYAAGPRVHLINFHPVYDQNWFVLPPYAEGGGGSAGENPTISVTEFYVTPFDRFVWNSPEESELSELSAGKVIGFGIDMLDYDADDDGGVYNLGKTGKPYVARSFVDGVLLGPGGEIPDESAVESITWARIKAQYGHVRDRE